MEPFPPHAADSRGSQTDTTEGLRLCLQAQVEQLRLESAQRLAAKEAAEADLPDHGGAASGLGCAKATGPLERHPTDKEAAAAITQETVTASPLLLAIGDEDTGEVRCLCHGSKGKRGALRQRQVAKRKLARTKARAARDTAREVVNQRLIALEVEAEQARQLAKESMAKAEVWSSRRRRRCRT